MRTEAGDGLLSLKEVVGEKIKEKMIIKHFWSDQIYERNFALVT